MLCYDRIEYSEGIDVNRKSVSKEYDICDYQYFLNYSIKVVDLELVFTDCFYNLGSTDQVMQNRIPELR